MASFMTFILFFHELYAGITCVNFMRVNTGLNPNLNNFEMVSANTRTRIECGAFCEIRECTSFIFNVTQKLCTLYSVYMSNDDGDILNEYYKRSDAEEYVNMEVAEHCSSENIPGTSTNVALNKNAESSSQYANISPVSLMVDGDRSSSYPCFTTAPENNPHATIDLLQSYEINGMYIVNRGDCCPGRLHNLVIKLGDTMSSIDTVFNHTNAIGADCTIIFDTPRRGRYVHLLLEANEYLTVCELEVYSEV